MQKIDGIASKVRFSTKVSGGENSTSTTQIAIFEIDKQPVELELPDSIMISDGDIISVTGRTKNGLFKALAYKNQTNLVSGKGPVTLYMFLGVIFTVIGIITIPFFIGLIFAPTGIFMCYKSRQYSKAYRIAAGT